MNTQLTAVVLTFNEEDNLPDCIQSLNGLDARLIVVDSGSTDRTVEIARRAGADVLEHPFENYSAQRNWAQANLTRPTEWVLHLDADERLTPELVREISMMLTNGTAAGVDGFMLRKRTIFMGRWIRHGGHYPTYHMRLFRLSRGRCEDRLYDQHFVVEGRVHRLQNDYLDVLASDLTTWTQRHARWAEFEAREQLAAITGSQVQAKFIGNPIERRRWLRTGIYGRAPLFARAFLYWFYRYFVRAGFLDGQEGLIFHFLQGFWFRFLIDAKVIELRRAGTGVTSAHHATSSVQS